MTATLHFFRNKGSKCVKENWLQNVMQQKTGTYLLFHRNGNRLLEPIDNQKIILCEFHLIFDYMLSWLSHVPTLW